MKGCTDFENTLFIRIHFPIPQLGGVSLSVAHLNDDEFLYNKIIKLKFMKFIHR